MDERPLQFLLQKIHQCQLCQQALPLGANPVIRARSQARILIIGQAPGLKVHHSDLPWNDASGKRLRQWLQLSPREFYDASKIAIMPMGLCYPGRGKSGDKPPRPECAPLWHPQVLKLLPELRLTLLVGQYAQRYYLQTNNLTETVLNWRHYLPQLLPLPHPSPRNQLWFKRNPWFDEELVPWLQPHIQKIIGEPMEPSAL
ncbi:uracil-DNA glycosylase family protein [Dongshaea marina]|uniref:uracil-DNA glycosylase family protein n=1 Tax=Dongshaea marina TaxID=2047966 RepID=UPI000D3E0A69|nr:uracil-DNA glycosylase family protein [Dongshaea marina]